MKLTTEEMAQAIIMHLTGRPDDPTPLLLKMLNDFRGEPERKQPDNTALSTPLTPETFRASLRYHTGLYEKFIVKRTDGTDAPGQKHHGCRYFVLDATHDPHAPPALLAYARSCESEYPVLAADLIDLAIKQDP